MRLISLKSNKDTFKTINFNPSGVSLIVGKQKDQTESTSGKTYNGVGKSLAIALVNFCLGSSKNKELESALPSWEFFLEFEINGIRYTSKRNTSTQNKIILNNEEISVHKFNATIGEKVFVIPETISGLSFRSLITRFLRPRKDSYVSFDSTWSNERTYQKLLCNAFLLGLNTELVAEKRRLKVEIDRIKTLRDNLKKDSIFLEFFTQNKNIDIELTDLEDKIEKLANDRKAFRIAKNYYEIQKEADDLKRELQGEKNKAAIITNSISNIKRTLEERPDVSMNKVIDIYNEAKTAMPEALLKTLQDVTNFHKTLISNREERLSSEKIRFERDFESVDGAINSLSKALDSKMQFLGTHGALDEFSELSNYINDLNAKAQKIKDYKDLLERYSDITQEISIALSNETKRTNVYLKEVNNLIKENMEMFRSFSKRFYPNKPGGLTVSLNEGDNQIRFNIDARIQDDASDGINEVKIFCFDMTILMAQHSHQNKFLLHDSRLYSDIDPRQRAELFKVAYDFTKDGFQYIATVNEDQILSMKDQFTEKEFEEIILKNVVLELTDDSDSSKLLGIGLDMQY